MANPTTTTTTTHTTTQPPSKRLKLSDDHHHSLLPRLPDHIAHLCLSHISPTTLYSVCRSWRHLLYSTTFPPFRSLYTLSLPTTTTTAGAAAHGGDVLTLSSFDPISSKWITINSPPLPPFLHRHPSFFSRSLPIQTFTVSGNLVLIAATTVHRNIPFPAFSHPIIFNPLTNTWSTGPPLSTPRRWCAAGAFQDTVVVASGVGSHYTDTVARSVEKWVVRKIEYFDQKQRDFNRNWNKIESLDFSKLKTESFDEKRNGNCEKIQSLKCSGLKTESFDVKGNGNCEKIQSLKCSGLKTESFDEKRNENCEKIQSLKSSRLKTQSFEEKRYGNCENILSLESSGLKTESFDEKIYGNCEKIQSLKSSRLKAEFFEEKRYGNCENILSLKSSGLKTESFDEKRYGNCQKIQSLKHSELKTEPFNKKQRDSNENWIKMRSLKNSKLCREAIDAVGWKGKLCMVNVKGDYTKEGFIYNINSDEWVEMPMGMLGGWKGPVAAMEEETMYMVDESRGVLRRYNDDVDKWLDVMVDERLKGAEYIAAGGGKVCVVCENHVGIVVVDVAVAPPRLRVVETSPGHEILGVHILPRMCVPEF